MERELQAEIINVLETDGRYADSGDKVGYKKGFCFLRWGYFSRDN